jgi:hypothetical protein
MIKKAPFAALISSLVFFNACAGVQINKAAVERVKKVAVFAYSGYDMSKAEAPAGKTGAFEKIAGIFGQRGELQMLSAENAARAFSESFETGMSWDVVPLFTVKENEGYAKIYNLYRIKRAKDQAQKGLSSGKFGRNDYVDGLLSWDDVETLKPSERNALIGALGVDAIVKVKVGVRFVQKRNINVLGKLGVARRGVKVRVHATVYDKSSEGPIWADAANGSGPTLTAVEGVSGAKKVEAAVVEGVRNAVENLFRRYNEKG